MGHCQALAMSDTFHMAWMRIAGIMYRGRRIWYVVNARCPFVWRPWSVVSYEVCALAQSLRSPADPRARQPHVRL